MRLLDLYDPHVMPENLTEVFVNIQLIKVSYDYKVSSLRTHATLLAVMIQEVPLYNGSIFQLLFILELD